MGGPGFYLFELEKTDAFASLRVSQVRSGRPGVPSPSIYRFIVRSQPDPFMTTLDCADSSQSTPRRVETLTSLQALSLLNNRFNLEMAKRFADRLRSEATSCRFRWIGRCCRSTGRLPTDDERSELVGYARAARPDEPVPNVVQSQRVRVRGLIHWRPCNRKTDRDHAAPTRVSIDRRRRLRATSRWR